MYDDRTLERVLWWVTLPLLFVSPWAISELAKQPPIADLNLLFGLFFILLVFAHPVLDLIIALVKRKRIHFFKRLSAQASFVSNQPLDVCSEDILARISVLGFEVNETKPKPEITIVKKTDWTRIGTIACRYSGRVDFEITTSGTQIQSEVTLESSGVDTGESEFLRELCEFMCLKSPSFHLKSLSWLVSSGMCMSIVCAGLAIVECVHPLRNGFIYSSCAVAIIVHFLAIISLIREREYLYGFQLAVVGLWLAGIPFAALALSRFL